MAPEQQHYDVVVVGAGPAGLAAALFAARRGLRVRVVMKDLGGQLALTDWIENYPGAEPMSGRALCERMRDQAKRDGAAVTFGEVVSLSPPPDRRGGEGGWLVSTAEGEQIPTQTIILAFGLTPNDLGADGEERFRGKGVYYSAVDDAPSQDGKVVAVVGGGNSAVTAALAFAPRAAAVHLIHRRGEFRAERALLDRLADHPTITQHTARQVVELRGSDHVEQIVLAPTDPETGKLMIPPLPAAGEFCPRATHGRASRETKRARGGEVERSDCFLPVDSVFVHIGYSSRTKWLAGVIELNSKHEVITTRDCATSAPGIFAAGDLTDIMYKQAVISAGEGVKAALQAFKYLQEQGGKPAVMLDWDVRGKS